MRRPAAAGPYATTTLRRGLVLITLYSAIGSAARLAQDAALAWRYGTGPQVDAYFLLNSLMQLPIAVVLSTLTLLVAPSEAVPSLRAGGRLQTFRAEMLAAVLVLALLAWPLMWWGMTLAVHQTGAGLSAAASTIASANSLPMALAVGFGITGALFSSWMIAGNHRVLTLMEGLPALFLVGVLLLVPTPSVFWGTAAGLLLQLLVLLWLLWRAGEAVRPRLSFSSAGWSGMAGLGFVLLASQFAFTLTSLVDPFVAARLGPGAVAEIGFSNRLIVGLQGLLGTGLQRTGLPLLTALVGSEPRAARLLAWRWSVRAALCGLAVSAALALLAVPAVSLLFQRGNFVAADSREVARVLAWGGLQLPLYLAHLVLITALAATRAYRSLAAVALVGLLVKLLASAALVPEWGLPGLTVATALMYGAMAGVAWVGLSRRLGQAVTPG